jgi:AdoMet-dependent rRNA methyltransferase SPB1
VLIDLCAAPGGWLQVAAKYMPSGSTIIGVDLMPIKPIRGVISHREDITTQECRTMLRRDMGSRKADVVLHDGAPNVGQNWTKDAYTQSELVLCSLKLAVEFLRPHGMFITKVFRSTDYNSLLWVFNQLFGKVEATKPHSSRNASAEIFVVCRDFRAPDRIDPKLLDPRYVFKELDDLVGSGTGVAGGGGASALTVLDKKATQHNKRQREGYDETLGPLLTKRVPVLTFMRSEQPVRVLTDASALVFDEETKGLGVDGHKYTTPEIVACCGDLKVLGKKDFKDLLRWRFAVRRSVPAAAIPLPSEAGAVEEDGDEESGSDDSGSEGGDGSEGSTDAEEEAEAAELSAAAAEELRRRKKEKKRDARMKAKAVRRQRLGMGLRNIDMTDQDHELFNLADLQRLARRVGEGSAAAAGAGAGSDDPLAAIREVNLEDGSSSHALAAAYGGPSAALRSALFGDEADLEFATASGEGAGGHAAADSDEEEDEEEGAPPAVLGPDGELAVDVVGALRDQDRSKRLGQLEDDFDRAYALYLAKREKRAAESAAALERGDGRSKGIKLSRMERLKQQAVLTEAALSGQIDAEHQKYLKMLANARSEAEAAAAASSEPTTVSGVKRRRPDGEESDEDDDSSLDLSEEEEGEDDDEDDDSEDEEDEDDEEDGDDIEDAEVEDEDRAEAAAERVLAGRARSAAGKGSSSGHPISAGPRGASASLTASTKANRWFSNDLFSSVLAAPPAAGAGAPAAAAAAGAGGKRAAAAMQLDADSEEEEEGSGAAAVPTATTKRARVAAAAAAAAANGGTGATVGAVGKDGEPDWLAGLPRSERDKWHDKLRRQRERKERAATRFARKEGGMKVVSSGKVAAEDADDEFSRVVAALAGGDAAAAAGIDDEEGGDHHFTDRAGRRHGGGAGSDSEDSAAAGRRKPAAPAVAFDAIGAARQQARRELIKAGMGAAVAAVRGKAALAALEADADASGDEGAAAEADTGFEVVPAPRERRGGYDSGSGTDSDDDSDDDAGSGDEDVAAGKAAAARPESPDPRSQLYDPDTHAELLALGAKMRSHSSAKALVDASYNRYAFDDVGMPAWFEADEARHFKPQLPVTKAEVDAIRERFREIAARPVARVAEARARKRLRVDKKLAKIKKQAEGIEESEEVQGRSKQRALARLYKGAEVRRPSSVYIVSSSGGSHGAAQARAKRKGSNVKVVDPRLKKDLKAQRRVAAKQKGGRGGGGGGRKGKAGKGPAAKRARR